MQVHFFNTYLQGGAAYGAINAFENIIKDYSDVDGRFFYMMDLSNGEKLKKLTSELYYQRHPLQLNSNLLNKIANSIKARSHYQTVCRSLKGRDGIYEQFSTANQYYSTPYPFFSESLPQIIHLNWIAEWIDYESFFARGAVRYFIRDNMMLQGELQYTEGNVHGDPLDVIGWGLKAEYGLESMPFSLMAEYRGTHGSVDGENATEHAGLVGFSFALGASSLREQDRYGATLETPSFLLRAAEW